MNKSILISLSLFFFSFSCGQTQQNKEHKSKTMSTLPFTNELIHESSPYLLQHAHNPVNWYRWGEDALQKAKTENKMLIISVGYAACHWCHVMEHESFEDTAVARIMNEYFVSIKVDREERPDIDQIYMNAAYIVNGSGGWPLNVIALPNGKPFFTGTYFPKKDWIKVLNYFVELKKNNPSLLVEESEKITNGIHATENTPIEKKETTFTITNLDTIFDTSKSSIDFQKGGGNRAPKFPMPNNWEYLLHYYYLSTNQEALKAVTTTLDNMAFGGIYDHIGGGFARYSTDENWHVPHFEKMLYDNAQLVSLYSHAYQVTKNPLYKKVVYETLEFIKRELTSKEAGFYSSLDADSEREEGKFYVWTKTEIEKELNVDAPLFNDYYNVTLAGNWEHGKNILFRNEADETFLKKYNLLLYDLQKNISKDKNKLLETRSKRIRPGLDDKILTSWNALMLKGYVDAYRTFSEKIFIDAALKNADFLVKNAIGKEGITRNYKNGKSTIPGFLDDYAFVISAFIELYQATFDEQWLNKAHELTEYTNTHFYDVTSGMYYYTHNNYSNLISRKMEIADNVIPSSNSEMAKNLLFLGHYFYKDEYIKTSEQMIKNVQKEVHQNIYFYSNWGIVEALFSAPINEVAVVGKDVENIRIGLDKNYLPNVILSGTTNKSNLSLLENKLMVGQTTIYVCQNKSCKMPTTDVKVALQQIEK